VSHTIDCQGKTTREINTLLRQAIAAGHKEVRVLNTEARHNLGVALLQPVHVVFDGSVGYYCGGMMDGASVEVKGSAGWGTGESMMGGSIVIAGNAGSGLAASIRGGTVVVKGDAAARAGVSMKGGTLLIGGNCGSMAGFMMQKGAIVICGNVADAVADSMYEGTVYVAGQVANLGHDAVYADVSDDDKTFLDQLLATYKVPCAGTFRKIVSGRKLWNFDKKDLEVWKAAL